MNFDTITSDTFLIYATKQYNNPSCTTIEEFNADLRLFVSIKRWLNKPPNKLNIRMLTNQIVIASNLFGVKATVKLLFCFIDEKRHNRLKSVLLYLNFLPDNINEADISSISLCDDINKLLQEL